MPCVGFEPTIPASERAKTVHALDRAATVTCAKSFPIYYSPVIISFDSIYSEIILLLLLLLLLPFYRLSRFVSSLVIFCVYTCNRALHLASVLLSLHVNKHELNGIELLLFLFTAIGCSPGGSRSYTDTGKKLIEATKILC
jgi:hypothetical protein